MAKSLDVSNPADVALAIAATFRIPEGATVDDAVLVELGRLTQASVDECSPYTRERYAGAATKRLREVDPAVRVAAVVEATTSSVRTATLDGQDAVGRVRGSEVRIVVGAEADRAVEAAARAAAWDRAKDAPGTVVVDGRA